MSWGSLGLSDGEEITFTITATVRDNTSDGHVLVNTVKVRSEDKGLAAIDTDTTVVETSAEPQGAIAAAQTPSGPQPVPVTAGTGAGLFGWLSSLLVRPVLALVALVS